VCAEVGTIRLERASSLRDFDTALQDPRLAETGVSLAHMAEHWMLLATSRAITS
jgi:hypothetical protein